MGIFDDFLTVPFEHIFTVTTKAPGVKRILFNDPATVVFWDDGTKTVVKAAEGDKYVPYYGFLAALAKKIYGSNAKVQDMIRPFLPETEKKPEGVPFGRFLNCMENERKPHGDEDGDKELDELFKALGLLTFLKDMKENG